MEKPEDKARKDIDAALTAAGWTIQSRNEANVLATRALRGLSRSGAAIPLLVAGGKSLWI